MTFCEVIPSHSFALWLMNHIDALMRHIGVSRSPLLDQILYVTCIVLVGIGLGLLVKYVVLFSVNKFVSLRHSGFARDMLDQNVLVHCSHVIPPLVILALIPFALNQSDLSVWMIRILVVYTIVVVCIAINAILRFVWKRYDERENTRNLPLKGIVITLEGLIWIVATIIAVSVIINRSPTTLLAGLGAFAAALMLIFKDSILGFTAGIQLALNDMVHVGDWITVPSTPANGTVIDVSLTAVKIRNFDNTIITCPPYTLVSTSFQNWRGMTVSGCRRIARAVTFEFSSVKHIDDKRVDEIAAQVPLLQKFVSAAKTSGTRFNEGYDVVNGTTETNLGLFRAYMCQYILTSDQFNHESQVLVRLMEPTSYGMPLQIYCFAATTNWTKYESIQSALFEHVTAMAPIFGLNIYNSPSSVDIDQIQLLDETGNPQSALRITSTADPAADKD